MTTSYDDLEQAWRREFHSDELQQLKPGLVKDLSSYVKRLIATRENSDVKSLKAELVEDELLRTRHLLSQLLDRRLYKLLSNREVQTSSLDPAEKEAHDILSSLLRDNDKMRREIFSGREPILQKSKNRSLLLLRFEKAVPSIIGVDLKTHGPFQKEDVARLPVENAETLIRQGAAAEIADHRDDNG